MPRTEVRSIQILNATVGRSDVNVATAGEAIVAKIVAGSGISISGTGADVGTGDVTINASGSVTAHQTTHQYGSGSDVIANAAYENKANTFTVTQTLSSANPVLRFIDTSMAVDVKTFRIINSSQQLYVQSMLDSGSTQAVCITITRTGDVTVGNNLTATGSGGNVACKDQANTFTVNQTISKSIPKIILDDNTQGTARKFQIFNYSQNYTVQAVDNAETVGLGYMLLSRQGDLTASGGITAATAVGNVACKNQANTFTQGQTISNSLPLLTLNETVAPVNAKRWDIYAGGQQLVVQTADDAGGSPTYPLIITRAGGVTVGGSTGNVACKNQANIFTQPQGISFSSPSLDLEDTAQTSNLRRWRIWNSSQLLLIDAFSDDFSVIHSRSYFTRNGTLTLSGDLVEKNRSIPMGHWTDVPFSAGNYTTVGGGAFYCNSILSQRYTLMGKTCTYTFYLHVSVSGGPTQLRIALPAGVVSATYTGNVFFAATLPALLQVAPGDNYMNLFRIPTSNPWADVTDYWAGSLTFSIQ